MKRTKEQVKEEIEKLLNNGWTQQNIDNIGFCPGCGSFGCEDCDDYCPELNAMLNDPEFQRACLQEEMEWAERNAGWDSRP